MNGGDATYSLALIVGAVAVACLFGEAQASDEAAPSAGCTTSDCHAEIARRTHVHQPVAANRCDFCHTPVAGGTPLEAGAKHAFKRAADNAELCYACHDRFGTEAYVHEPVKMGLCVLCHDPHGSDRRFFLLVETDRESCMQCHREAFSQGDHVHGPVDIGACGACHDPHQSPNRFRLRSSGDRRCGMCHLAEVREVTSAEWPHQPAVEDCTNCHEPHRSPNPFRLIGLPPTLCLDCHEDIAREVAGGKVAHKPVAEGKCGECHEHHGGGFRKLLRGRFTSKAYEPFDLGHYDLCYSCHESSQVTEELTADATGFRNGNVNLHFKHVNQKDKGRTCNMCHAVHVAPNPGLVTDTAPFGKWRLPLNYEQ